MNMQNINAFRFWWDYGYRDLLPIVPPGVQLAPKWADKVNQLGKMPGIRYGNGLWGPIKGWYNLQPTEADVETWNAMGASVGLRTGKAFLLDIDAYDERTGQLIEDAFIKALGPAPVRIGQWPKRALLYRTETPFRIKILKFTGYEGRPGQIEMPAQVVISGSHARTLKAYDWPRDLVPFDDLSCVTKDQVNAVLAQLAAILPDGKLSGTSDDAGDALSPAALMAPAELVRQAVALLPNTYEKGGYDAWRDIAQMIRGALPDDPDAGCDIFCSFTERGDVSDPQEDAIRIYNSLGPSRVLGFPNLVDKVYKHTGFRIDASLYFDKAGAELFAVAPKAPPKLFNFTSFAEAADTAVIFAARPLIKGLLDQGAMTVLYGESNAGKTFVAMDLAYHIARGDAWSGMRAAKFPVLYVAAEGGLGARKRAVALSMRRGACDGFSFLLHPINLLHPDADLQPLIASIEATGLDYGLIVIDTLSRVMAGGDENGPGDMGAMVRHLDKLRNATKAHIMVVHHSGKDRAKGARGHSLLRAATDTEIEVANREISVTKQRDLDGSFTRGFLLDVVTLGIDEDGDTITSCVVKLVADDEKEIVVPTPRENDVLRALQAVLKASPLPELGATHTEIMAYLSAYGITMNADNVRFYLRSLYDKSITDRIGRGKWRLKAEKKAFSVTDPKRFLELQTEKSGEKSGESVFE